MNSVTGLIELKKPVDFDGLSTNPISLVVIAVDGGSVARTATLTVDVTVTDVNDNMPVCTQAAYALLMAENVAVGFTVRITSFIVYYSFNYYDVVRPLKTINCYELIE